MTPRVQASRRMSSTPALNVYLVVSSDEPASFFRSGECVLEEAWQREKRARFRSCGVMLVSARMSAEEDRREGGVGMAKAGGVATLEGVPVF